MKNTIININDAIFEKHCHGKSYYADIAYLSKSIGMSKLGCNITIVPPGKKAWPFHSHHVNEELFYILSGNGSIRIGSEIFTLKSGDIISAPTGGEECAHQIINTSAEDLKYLAISTMTAPDVMEYPDSEKFGVFVGSPPMGDESKRNFSYFGYQKNQVDYWENE